MPFYHSLTYLVISYMNLVILDQSTMGQLS